MDMGIRRIRAACLTVQRVTTLALESTSAVRGLEDKDDGRFADHRRSGDGGGDVLTAMADRAIAGFLCDFEGSKRALQALASWHSRLVEQRPRFISNFPGGVTSSTKT